MDQITTPHYSRRVHIIPVYKNRNYATEPPIEMKADKVYLITDKIKYMSKLTSDITTKLSTAIKQGHIELISARYINDLYTAIGIFRKIIKAERGNQIFINLTSGPQLWCIAGVLATQLFQDDSTEIKPYYIIPMEPPNTGIQVYPITIPYRLDKPSDDLLHALSIFAELRDNNLKVSKTNIIDLFERDHLPISNDSRSLPGIYNALQRRYIDPLMQLGFIEAQGPEKRRVYGVTESGNNALTSLWD